ncbi:hypothetical protein, partial [Lactococcus hircilactis]
YESGDLIHRALEDIADLGDTFMVIAIYDGEFITDYIDCDTPTREEMDGATDKEFNKAVAEYKQDMKKLEGKEYEAMNLKELLVKLKKQDSIL